MRDPYMILLIFAPATVGLIITALRRASPVVYWAGLIGVLTLAWVGVGHLELDSTSTSPLAFMVTAVMIPTLAAFWIGRRLVPDYGGAHIFAGSSTTYLFALVVAVGRAFFLQQIGP